MELRIQINEATLDILAVLRHNYPEEIAIEEIAGRLLIYFTAFLTRAKSGSEGQGTFSLLCRKMLEDNPMLAEGV